MKALSILDHITWGVRAGRRKYRFAKCKSDLSQAGRYLSSFGLNGKCPVCIAWHSDGAVTQLTMLSRIPRTQTII